MTFEEFCNKVMVVYSNPKNLNLRYGQITFNLLADERPDLAAKIRGTELDPFYTIDSDRIADFYNWLQENWNQE